MAFGDSLLVLLEINVRQYKFCNRPPGVGWFYFRIIVTNPQGMSWLCSIDAKKQWKYFVPHSVHWSIALVHSSTASVILPCSSAMAIISTMKPIHFIGETTYKMHFWGQKGVVFHWKNERFCALYWYYQEKTSIDNIGRGRKSYCFSWGRNQPFQPKKWFFRGFRVRPLKESRLS